MSADNPTLISLRMVAQEFANEFGRALMVPQQDGSCAVAVPGMLHVFIPWDDKVRALSLDDFQTRHMEPFVGTLRDVLAQREAQGRSTQAMMAPPQAGEYALCSRRVVP